METSVVPKKLFAFIIESSRRSFLLAWIAIANALSRSRYMLVMANGRFVKIKVAVQKTHPAYHYSRQELVFLSTRT